MMSSNKFLTNISVEEIRELELKSFEGNIILVDKISDLRYALHRLDHSQVLGFDTETKPSFSKGKKNEVSLLQLANSETACLFRINKIGLPDELKKILGSTKIIKPGVAIHDDLRFLGHISKFRSEGFVDLQKLVREYGIESSGLKKLAAIILGIRISKSQQVTNWEAPVLSVPQQLYAATDAWVCYEIYRKLTE